MMRKLKFREIAATQLYTVTCLGSIPCATRDGQSLVRVSSDAPMASQYERPATKGNNNKTG